MAKPKSREPKAKPQPAKTQAPPKNTATKKAAAKQALRQKSPSPSPEVDEDELQAAEISLNVESDSAEEEFSAEGLLDTGVDIDSEEDDSDSVDEDYDDIIAAEEADGATEVEDEGEDDVEDVISEIEVIHDDEEDDSDDETASTTLPAADASLTLTLDTETEKTIKTKISKKRAKNATTEDTPGVLYIGRIPHGFYETQMRSYFSQFGDITRLRLSRNKHTGKSKHYAFIEFASEEVAQIVAETMNNYLLFGHLLKVSVVPPEKVHAKLFVGADKKFKQIPGAKLAKHRHDKKRTIDDLKKLVDREEKRRKTKQDKLAELGIDYVIPAPALKTA
ncbi:uncharacterized protein V1518DRAFT_413867 [Limtongia smithiae]|uniref:uncharacterized protein n=1 Tax=Limtongia smithiae TaxID=1125753 RepID=UPI0034CFB232